MTQNSNLSRVMEKDTVSKNGTCMEKGKTCPRCGSTNTDCQNGIWYCYDCQKEF